MARKIAVEIVGDSSSLERAFKRSSTSAQNFNRDIGKTGKTRGAFSGLAKGAGLLTGALGIGGLAGAAKAAFGEMGDAQKASAQTEAVLKSTGGAANVSAKHVDALATSLLNVSGVDDEVIKSGENMLLTFTNIKNQVGKGNDVFDQATKATLDLSTATGKDMSSSAVLVGKALNDPVKGLTALSRVGVKFTDGQKKQIKTMVKSGDTMGAQKIILKELNTEFGGSAEAAGKTLPGQLNKLKETALNLGGALAQTLSPQITTLVTNLTKWLSKSKNQKTIMDIAKGAADAFATTLGVLKAAFKVLSDIVGGNKRAIELLIAMYASWKILTFANKVLTLATNFGTLASKQRSAKGAAGGLKGSLAGKAGLAAAVGLTAWELSKMIRKIPGWDKKMKAFGGTLHDVATSLGLVSDPMAKFEGKNAPSPEATGKIRRQAAKLRAGGMSARDVANLIASRHPGFAKSDIETITGLRGRTPQVNVKLGQRPRTPGLTPRQAGNVFNRRPGRDPEVLTRPIRAGTTINGGLHLHGIQNPRQLEDALTKRSKQRPHRRRGT